VFHNYATRVVVRAHRLAWDALEFFDGWRTLADFAAHRPEFERRALGALVRLMVGRTLLLRSDRPVPLEEQLMARLDRWNPSAGFFHTSTKDIAYVEPLDGVRALRRQARSWPSPPPVKRYARAPAVALPAPRTDGEFAEVLLARRTWRQFSARPIDVTALGTLLGLTSGVQHWVRVPAQGELALKTSPSGGARHPLETYVAVQHVSGLPTGLYHYRADTHRLELLSSRQRAVPIERYLPTQDWYQPAGALVFFTALFDRSLWKYSYARAYRAVLIEAGHLCQTFCLVATWLGLAPFCSMALADRAIEGDLGIDGISESVLYAAGVGARPAPGVPAMKPAGRPPLHVRANASMGAPGPARPGSRTSRRRSP
jgi:SagB-type dehydrogenase family enzyme